MTNHRLAETKYDAAGAFRRGGARRIGVKSCLWSGHVVLWRRWGGAGTLVACTLADKGLAAANVQIVARTKMLI
ncbi:MULTISPECIES: hypothetical protein [unclassified Arthrobacter]|uniref:hypothetical protein n=1 Tax=unclassified Arthrobacter TaxID=235627 RepID=UPI0008A1CEEE|nr:MULTISPECIES: hypothetical protein [unclassified Arthrobacter]OFT44700.1 hypothetical protein HMPREF3160_00165 [Arthrobacter sp. HMSC06H05]